MVDADINKLDKSSSAEEVQGSQAAPITHELLSVSTVTSLTEKGSVLSDMSSRFFEEPGKIIQVESPSTQANDLSDMIKDMENKLEQVRQTPSDRLMEIGKEEILDMLTLVNSLDIPEDLDGDGIPDDYDKYPGETVSNVAARINKIGKYADTDGNKTKVFSAVKDITKSLESLLNKISAMSAAASSSVKPATDALEMDGLGGDEKTSSIEKSRQK
jgi:hypothetical protein